MRIVQANLITKTDFDAKLSSLNRKITQNKSKHLLVENELNTLKNKIPDVSSLVKKTDYNTKIGEIDAKVSNLDGKIDKNITDIVKVIALLLSTGNVLFDGGDGSQAYLIFQPVNILNLLLVLLTFHHGNLKDYLIKVLNHLQHLILILLQ